MLVDWLTIKTEYINSNISQRDIAKKYNVSFSTLQVRARKEKWTEERKKQYDEIEASVRQKALDVISKQKIDRVTKLLTISDALVEQLETATQQLNKQMIRNKRKKRTVEYKDSKAMGKPTKEIIPMATIIIYLRCVTRWSVCGAGGGNNCFKIYSDG